jgi:hypothetical protein
MPFYGRTMERCRSPRHTPYSAPKQLRPGTPIEVQLRGLASAFGLQKAPLHAGLAWHGRLDLEEKQIKGGNEGEGPG